MRDHEQQTGATAPATDRPHLPSTYGVPANDEGVLPWTWAIERLEKAHNYWVVTVSPEGKPVARPVWASWLDGVLYFDGHPQTRWGRNLASNPTMEVHLESGDEVVILEGTVEDIAKASPDLATKLGEAFAAKYDYKPDTAAWEERGLYSLRPQVAYGWDRFPTTVTRWRFNR